MPGFFRFCAAELSVMKLFVSSAESEKLLVRSGFDDVTFFENKDQIGILNGA